MARADLSHPGNVPGDLFVDETCIACDTCRRFAPAVFGGGEDDPSWVARQPAGAGEREPALWALVACPVGAIGSRSGEGVAEAAHAFPVALPAALGVPDVLACGHAARGSFGAAAWLVLRPDGNVLVDSPRFSAPLLARLRALGGARFMFLTHRDDVADHARWSAALGCERVLHARDVTGGTRDVERVIEGAEAVELAPDLRVVPVPGHTPGSATLLFRGEVAFTGDHLWGDASGALGAARSVCWYDWGEQARSMARLARESFRVVLPGHGRPWAGPSAAAAAGAVAALAEAMGGG